MQQILRRALHYFALVFGAGFVLGILRVLVLAPLLGARTAELLEMPVMLVVIVLAARRVILPTGRLASLAVGVLALGLMLLAEVALVLARGSTLQAHIAQRDPVAGTVYLALLIVFALLPALWADRRRRTAVSAQ